MDSLNAVLNREEGYLFDYDRLRALLSKQDRSIEEPAPEDPVARWDCPKCGRGNLLLEVPTHPSRKCDHCGAKFNC